MSSHEGEGDQSPALQVLMNEMIDGFTIFEAAEQCRKTIRLIIQGEHRLMHERERGTACFS
jgi:hypothetical protein